MIYNLFEGITLYVHRVLHDCYYYVEAKEICSKEEAKLFSDNYINECGTNIKKILSGISESQKELLYAASAEKQPHALLPEHSSSYIISSPQVQFKVLIAEGFLTKNGNAYSLSNPMTRIWLENR
ncbi:MAG: hypothetical protein KBS95_08080 [Alistipes sp.]|nr:hypothetical protein [Candidatus Alistipes equi]